MARIRTVKPEFFRHEALFEAERRSGLPLRLAFVGLWTSADREGRFKWRPRQLKLDALPFDDLDFGLVLDELAKHGFIVQYQHGGEPLGYIPSWSRHQVINNREKDSELPPPQVDACPTRDGPVDDTLTTRAAPDDDGSATPLVHAPVEGEGKGKEWNGRELTEGSASRAPMSIADLVSDGLTEKTAADLMELRKLKGLKVLMRCAWTEFKAKCEAADRSTEEVVDHLIGTSGHLEGFQPEHLKQWGAPTPAPGLGALWSALERTRAMHSGQQQAADVGLRC